MGVESTLERLTHTTGFEARPLFQSTRLLCKADQRRDRIMRWSGKCNHVPLRAVSPEFNIVWINSLQADVGSLPKNMRLTRTYSTGSHGAAT